MVAPPHQRRAQAKAALREKILSAARVLFAQHGYEAVTMRAIGRKIGYTATALYYHFPDKAALLRELCETDFRTLSDYFKSLGTIADPVERIRRTSRAYVSFGLEYPHHYRFMFMMPRPQPPPEALRIEQGNPDQDAYAFLLQAVREALTARRFRPELTDAHLIAQGVWAAVHGVVALHLTQCDEGWVDWRPADRTAALLEESFLRGMLR